MLELYRTIDSIVDAYNLDLPELYKRRDPKEPHRAAKEAWEDKLYAAVRKRFGVQKKLIRDRLENFPPGKKSADDWIRNLDLNDPNTRKMLLQIFMGIMDEGIQRFALSSEIQLDWTQVNQQAADWVEEHYYNHMDGDPELKGWIDAIDDTLKDGLKRELGNFIKEPAYTIGDVMKGLSPELSEQRAQRIAVTEVTRTFAQADQQAAKAIQDEFPDTIVVKRWFTNRDDLVCPICAPLHNNVVKINDEFAPGIMNPPAHPNCRCWRQTETKLKE